MISPIIPEKDWRRALNNASSSLKIIVWAESDHKVIEAWACDTMEEAEKKAEELDDVGEAFITDQGGVQ